MLSLNFSGPHFTRIFFFVRMIIKNWTWNTSIWNHAQIADHVIVNVWIQTEKKYVCIYQNPVTVTRKYYDATFEWVKNWDMLKCVTELMIKSKILSLKKMKKKSLEMFFFFRSKDKVDYFSSVLKNRGIL